MQKGNFVLNLQADDNDSFHTYILHDNEYSDSFRTLLQKRLYETKQNFIRLLNDWLDDKIEAFAEKKFNYCSCLFS